MRFIQKGQLLSFGWKLHVELNDSCVRGSVTISRVHADQSGMARFKCGLWIVTHMWEQEKRSIYFCSRCFLFGKDSEEAREPVLVLSIALHMQLKPWRIFFFYFTVCLHMFIQQFFSSSSWVHRQQSGAVICVHNKQVQDKESKLRFWLDLCFSAFHYSTEAQGSLTTAETE